MYTDKPQEHEMILSNVHETGEEEWYCPTCGRRFLMQWPPEYKKVILDPGDEFAIHTGGKGGLTVQPAQVTQEEQIPGELDPYLTPWANWMEKVDFESWWNREA